MNIKNLFNIGDFASLVFVDDDDSDGYGRVRVVGIEIDNTDIYYRVIGPEESITKAHAKVKVNFINDLPNGWAEGIVHEEELNFDIETV